MIVSVFMCNLSVKCGKITHCVVNDRHSNVDRNSIAHSHESAAVNVIPGILHISSARWRHNSASKLIQSTDGGTSPRYKWYSMSTSLLIRVTATVRRFRLADR